MRGAGQMQTPASVVFYMRHEANCDCCFRSVFIHYTTCFDAEEG
jgi:hypothetical protein